MVKQYETVFIMTPVLSDEQIKETVGKYQSLLKENKAEIVDENIWGMRKLAYPIQKKNEGYYVVVEFTGNPELPKELDRRMRIMDAVIRHLIINKDER